jgi:hypothetical protein
MLAKIVFFFDAENAYNISTIINIRLDENKNCIFFYSILQIILSGCVYFLKMMLICREGSTYMRLVTKIVWIIKLGNK